MKSNFFATKKQHFLETCTQCGICAAMCPVIKETEIRELSPKSIQQSLYRYMQDEKQNDIVSIRAFSCMKCFKCTTDVCPKDLNPLLMNEIIISEYSKSNKETSSQHKDPYEDHTILSRIQTTDDEYKRITTPIKKAAKFLFFPGCNVYLQPEKILHTLDILDLIGNEYSFIPGMDNCCGDRCFGIGKLEKGITLTNNFMKAIEEYQPEVLLVWCSTCHCRLSSYIDDATYKHIHIMSIHEYILNNIEKLSFVEKKMTITLHEACKASYTGLDNDAPRKLLKKIPGVELIEMEHHGKNTLCCGSNTKSCLPTIFNTVLTNRLDEVDDTGAQHLVAVCHFCELNFFLHEKNRTYTTINIISLIAHSLGIIRTATMREYTLFGEMRKLFPNKRIELEHMGYSESDVTNALERILS